MHQGYEARALTYEIECRGELPHCFTVPFDITIVPRAQGRS